MVRYRSHLLKYAGEFIIIFSSITFTWWFDDWRQERDDLKEEVVLLNNLNSNLEIDSANIQNELDYILRSEFTFNDFLEKLKAGNFKDTDSSGLLIRRLIIAPEFHPNNATFEAIKATGELKLIRDDSLVNAMMNLYEVSYQELDFLLGVYNQTSTQTIWNYAIENHDLTRVLGSPQDRIFKFEMGKSEDRQLLINKIMFTKMAVTYSKFRMANCLERISDVRRRIKWRLTDLKAS